MEIIRDDLTNADVVDFLAEHLVDMRSVSPPESTHALDVRGLRAPDVSFWVLRDEGEVRACGALKELSPVHGEIKSMRTCSRHRGQGLAAKMLAHIVREAMGRGYTRLSLETGSMDYFRPARAFYEKHGFVECGPYADYNLDANSIFMTKPL